MSLMLAVFASLTALSFFCYTLTQGLRQNISVAKATGLHYVITPIYITSFPWLLLQPILVPFLECLPESWTEKWLTYIFLETQTARLD